MKTTWPRAIVVIICAALGVAACGGPAHHAGSAPRPPLVPGQVTAGPDLAGVQLPNVIVPLISGGVSLPKRSLTPGEVTTTDTTKVCNLAPAAQAETVPLSLENAVYDEYGYTNPAQRGDFLLDLLVPVSLGGAVTQANIWPAAVQGTGFVQKKQLDHILKDLVCRRFITLKHAQHALETDWYAAWLKYVVSTGHI